MIASRHLQAIQTGVNNPILRSLSEEVDKIDKELVYFCQEMVKTMWSNKGVGLAAPQVGLNKRIIVTTQRERKKGKDEWISETIMINPVIVQKSDEMIIREEACLSVPDELGQVRRYKSIILQYQDLKGTTFKKKYKDFNAVIIQHEIDHLDGILFVDKLIKKPQKTAKSKKI